MIKKNIIYILLYIWTLSIILSVFYIQPKNIENNIYIDIFIYFFITLLIIKYLKTIIMLMIAPWNYLLKYKRYEKFKNKLKNFNPLVSVIIPAYNEEIGLINTIKTIEKSIYKNIEIIVVNDGSTDNSHKLMLDYLSKREREREKGVVV